MSPGESPFWHGGGEPKTGEESDLKRQLAKKDAEIRKWKKAVIEWQDADSDNQEKIERLRLQADCPYQHISGFHCKKCGWWPGGMDKRFQKD